jgi:spore coat protein CotF
MSIIYNYEFVKEKIQKELTETQKKGSQKVKAIASHVAEKLIKFAENKTFGLAIQESESTLADCCKEILKDVNNHISDIEVYKRAAKFYFPSAEVEFTMNILVSEDKSNNGQRIDISFDDLF